MTEAEMLTTLLVDPALTRRALRDGEMSAEFDSQLRKAGGDVLAEVFAYLLGNPSKTQILARAVEMYRGFRARGLKGRRHKEAAMSEVVARYSDRVPEKSIRRNCEKPNGDVYDELKRRRRLRSFSANLD